MNGIRWLLVAGALAGWNTSLGQKLYADIASLEELEIRVTERKKGLLSRDREREKVSPERFRLAA